MLGRFLFFPFLFLERHPKIPSRSIFVLVAGALTFLGVSKTYQSWDDDPARGAIAISDGEFGESYSIPVYLEQANLDQLFRPNKNINRFRYLPQKASFFNPAALPVVHLHGPAVLATRAEDGVEGGELPAILAP